MTCCRLKGQYPEIHCDRPFPLFIEEKPKDTPPPSLPIMTKILTWFQSGILLLSYCTARKLSRVLTFDLLCRSKLVLEGGQMFKQHMNYMTISIAALLLACETGKECGAIHCL